MTGLQILALLLSICALFAVLLAIRSEVVGRARQEEFLLAYARDLADICSGRKLQNNYARYDALSYDQMLWDMRKWTHRQFYGQAPRTPSSAIVKDQT